MRKKLRRAIKHEVTREVRKQVRAARLELEADHIAGVDTPTHDLIKAVVEDQINDRVFSQIEQAVDNLYQQIVESQRGAKTPKQIQDEIAGQPIPNPSLSERNEGLAPIKMENGE